MVIVRILIALSLCAGSFEILADDARQNETQAGCQVDEAVKQADILAYAVQAADLSTPGLVENQANAASGAAANPVEGASRTNLVALAFDSGMVSSEGGVTSLSLAPVFDIIALRDPDVVDSQARYRTYEWARRLGVKVSSGGTGDAFDRDGDGVVDDALTSTSPSDIITYEISYQFGSRDRRDQSNFEEMLRKVAEPEKGMAEVRRFAAHVLLVAAANDGSLEKLSCPDLAKRMLENPDFRSAIESMHQRASALKPIVDEVARDIDSKPILRLVATGTQRKPKFGGDKRSFGIRLSKGLADTATGGSNLDLQLDYLRNELPMGGDELEGWKLGTKYTTTWLRDTKWFGEKGLLFSASGSVEKYSNAPAAMKDSVARLDLTWSFSVGEKALVPLSVTWANRTDLLKDQKDVIAHVGYSFDFDAFFKGVPH